MDKTNAPSPVAADNGYSERHKPLTVKARVTDDERAWIEGKKEEWAELWGDYGPLGEYARQLGELAAMAETAMNIGPVMWQGARMRRWCRRRLVLMLVALDERRAAERERMAQETCAVLTTAGCPASLAGK